MGEAGGSGEKRRQRSKDRKRDMEGERGEEVIQDRKMIDKEERGRRY